jgi:GcrA cell cycle regulator
LEFGNGGTNVPGIVWTDALTEEAMKLWQNGASASEIACHIGGVSRSAVLGKMHRCGLSNRTKHARAVLNAFAVRSNRPRPPVKRFHKPRKRANLTLRVRPFVGTAHPIPPPRVTDVARVSFLDMDEARIAVELVDGTTRIVTEHCKFPVLDEPAGPKVKQFCGDQRVQGMPYCEAHSRRAYSGPEPASRLPRAVEIRTKEFA